MSDHIERAQIYADISRFLIDKNSADLTDCEDGWTSAISKAMDVIKNAPAADVRPERHGRWSDNMVSYMDDFNGDMHFGFRCSECKAILNKTRYCGNCGAKMDGKKV